MTLAERENKFVEDFVFEGTVIMSYSPHNRQPDIDLDDRKNLRPFLSGIWSGVIM